MAASSIIEVDSSPKIFIPTLTEASEPKNMPAQSQIEAWHDLICDADATSNKSIYKQKGVDPKSFNGRCRYRPESLFPQHDIVKNSVIYRFNVVVLTGEKDANGNWVIHTDDNGGLKIPKFITVDATGFLDNFELVTK